MRCYRCNKYGHYANNCPNPKLTGTKACTANAADKEETLEIKNAYICTVALDQNQRDEWVLDSGASQHMCCAESSMTSFRKSIINSIMDANQSRAAVKGVGEVIFQITSSNGSEKVLLRDVLSVPDLATNLISLSCVAKNRGRISIETSVCKIINVDNFVVMTGHLSTNGVYKLDLENVNIVNTQQLTEKADALLTVAKAEKMTV